jgi:signal transduction histidine kinase
MRSRRLSIGLILPAGLVVLVALLATLQYRWLGQVSEAERESLGTKLRQSAAELADDFDRELVVAYRSLQVDGTSLQNHDWASFAERFDTWRDRAKDPQIVKAVYLVNTNDKVSDYFIYQPDKRSFVKTTWPESLSTVKASVLKSRETIDVLRPQAGISAASGSTWQTATGIASQAMLALKPATFPDVPALVITMPSIASMNNVAYGGLPGTFNIHVSSSALVVELDRDHIRSTLLPALLARYFPGSVDQYRFSVVDNASPTTTVFSRGLATNASIDPKHADASVPLFALRLDLATQVVVRPVSPSDHPGDSTVRVETHEIGTMPMPTLRLDSPSAATPPVPPTSPRSSSMSVFFSGRGDYTVTSTPRGAWQLMVQHTAGSLDAAVGRARVRNLWLSFGILGVLAAGVALIVINAERSRKLASQQMDFVATVSHELRTPLTVIRSAAQNLSAGVVSDPAQAKRYGDLIESEGRRLTDMVEQVLEFAGLSGNRRLAQAQPVDVGAVARDVIETSSAIFEAEGVNVQLQIADKLPPVLADEGAVRRALNNLITNALKYGSDGRWIGITARRAGTAGTGSDEVQLSVSDRGRGIEADDLPHIFEAFYRGRYAVDRQIHGNGLGLSLVKRIAEAHGGRVTVSSVPGEGATFTLHFPTAAPDPSAIQPHADPLAAPGTPTA